MAIFNLTVTGDTPRITFAFSKVEETYAEVLMQFDVNSPQGNGTLKVTGPEGNVPANDAHVQVYIEGGYFRGCQSQFVNSTHPDLNNAVWVTPEVADAHTIIFKAHCQGYASGVLNMLLTVYFTNLHEE